MDDKIPPSRLRRTITLPLLIFYGLGVIVGAGIFALIGEVLRIAGDHAPLAFILAGLIACSTGISYALLVRVFPRAGGEAVYVNRGLGSLWGSLVGYGVAATGTISSAVIALAFAGYVHAIAPVPEAVLVIFVIAVLTGIAWFGVRESVWFAVAITILEVGTLAVIAISGLPLLADISIVAQTFVPPADGAILAGVISGSVIAFFAFIGFEDIVNMAEETVDPAWTASRAILWTLGLSVGIYVLLSVVAVMAPDRQAVATSSAPMAELFHQVTGLPGASVAVMAAVAMVNGILIQIVMVSRMLYGMANEGLAPRWFAKVDETHRTPSRATITVAGIILALALLFPLVQLAEATSLILLGVFTLVNLSLFALGGHHEDELLRRFRWWGLFSATVCIGILAFQLFAGVSGGH
ncbi:MAG: APC family permease [Pseudomonadota bacterium]